MRLQRFNPDAGLLRIALIAATLLTAAPAASAITTYRLDPAASTVAFETDFGPDVITGSIPLESADLRLDFAEVRNCTIDVTLDVSSAQASFPFAAQALKGPKVLDARAHPRMSFESVSIAPAGAAADVTGNLTIRGVTKVVTLRAEITRPNGSVAGDFAHLTVRLTGKIRRSDFGATGWADMVGDEVRILITARIDAKG